MWCLTRAHAHASTHRHTQAHTGTRIQDTHTHRTHTHAGHIQVTQDTLAGLKTAQKCGKGLRYPLRLLYLICLVIGDTHLLTVSCGSNAAVIVTLRMCGADASSQG